jgi:hypothetical protein
VPINALLDGRQRGVLMVCGRDVEVGVVVAPVLVASQWLFVDVAVRCRQRAGGKLRAAPLDVVIVELKDALPSHSVCGPVAGTASPYKVSCAPCKSL